MASTRCISTPLFLFLSIASFAQAPHCCSFVNIQHKIIQNSNQASSKSTAEDVARPCLLLRACVAGKRRRPRVTEQADMLHAPRQPSHLSSGSLPPTLRPGTPGHLQQVSHHRLTSMWCCCAFAWHSRALQRVAAYEYITSLTRSSAAVTCHSDVNKLLCCPRCVAMVCSFACFGFVVSVCVSAIGAKTLLCCRWLRCCCCCLTRRAHAAAATGTTLFSHSVHLHQAHSLTPSLLLSPLSPCGTCSPPRAQ